MYWLAQVCLVALLLVPIFLSAHHHTAPDESSACAVCIAVHNGPATVNPAIALHAPQVSMPIAPISADADATCVRDQQFDRGPPDASLLPTV